MSETDDGRAATACPECESSWICILLDHAPASQDFACNACRHEWTATF